MGAHGTRDADRGRRAVARSSARPGAAPNDHARDASTASTSNGSGCRRTPETGRAEPPTSSPSRSLLRAQQRALAREFRPDIVIASSTHPLDIYGARSIARRSGARLVFEVHDLWPLTPIELGGVSPRNPFIMAMDRAERYACRHADPVVSIPPAADDYLVTRGLDARALRAHPERHLDRGVRSRRGAPAGRARRADRQAAGRGHVHRRLHGRHRHGQCARRPRLARSRSCPTSA